MIMQQQGNHALVDDHYKTVKLLNLMFGTQDDPSSAPVAGITSDTRLSEHEVHLRTVVSGITHGINSPLACVSASLSMLRDLLLDPSQSAQHSSRLDDIRTLLDDGLEGVQRITELLVTLRHFSRVDLAARDHLNVHEALDRSLAIAQFMLKNTVIVRKEYRDVGRLACSPSRMNQVFLNIITNAAQAMNGRASIGQLVVKTSQPSPMQARIDIQDNGCGIAPQDLPKIFDPTFTTKGSGCGAGLAISQQLVRNQGGDILVTSELGVGTTFSILLPVKG
jgi:two-component system NtrC family sensor kinase